MWKHANDRQACLNAPEPAGNGENGVDDPNTVESPEEPVPQHLPQQQQPRQSMQTGAPQMHPNYMPQGMDPSQQRMLYNNYANQQNTGGHGMPQYSHQA